MEVTIATVIVGMVLFAAYGLGSKAFQLGRSARERNQASQLLQAQAEGLTAMRNSRSWAVFRAEIQGANTANFHLQRDGAERWVAATNSSTSICTNTGNRRTWDPQDNNSELSDNLYRLVVYGDFINSGTGAISSSGDKFHGTISVCWNRLGGGPEETSTLYLRLTDHSL